MTASRWQKAVWFGVAYFISAQAGRYLSEPNSTYISFWLPAGLTVGVLLLNPTRDWLWFLLAALPANFLFDLLHDPRPDPIVIGCFYGANLVQAATGAWLVRRFVTEQPTLATLKEYGGLLGFAAMLGTLLGAVVGATTLIHFGLSRSFAQSWKVWWGSTSMAVLLFTPFILAWFSKPTGTRRIVRPPKKIVEAALLVLGLVTYEWFLLARGQGIMSPDRIWSIPFLLWAGLRFGLRGATAISLAFSLSLAFFTTQFSIGLTPSQISSGDYVFLMQTILGMASLVALTPAIVIGERDRTLAALRESEERFRNLTAAAFEGIGISENGRILDMNDQGLKMLGYTREEIVGKAVLELVAPESRDIVGQAIRENREVIYGHQLLRKDGSVFYAEAQARTVRIGRRTVRMTALRDITERKKAEQALRESEEKYAKVFRNSPDAVTITRLADGCIIETNEGFQRVFGYPPEAVVGRTSLELQLWGNPADRDRVLQEVRQNGFVRAWELPFRTCDGKMGVGELSAEKIEIHGESCLVTVVHDITERKQAEAERAESIRREQQARAEYTLQLIASQEAERARIAAELHDSLGQDLLLVKNRAQLALTRKKLPAALREQLESIGAIASRSVAEARQISHDLHPPQLDHLGLTRALEAMIDSAAEASGIVFERKLDDVDGLFPKDAALNLYRVVQESLNNIIKHSHARQARIRLEHDLREVQLHLEDDGDGFKVNETANGGKGLGLKNIAERVRILGGRLKIDSQPGQGARIQVNLPTAYGE